MIRQVQTVRNITRLFWSIVLALLITLSACAPKPTPTSLETCDNDYVVVSGSGFQCKTSGNAYRFIGANIRGLAYIDRPGSAFSTGATYRVDLSGNNRGIVQKQLETAAQMGVKVIRFYAPYATYTKSQIFDSIDRVLAISQLLATQGRIPQIKFLIVFTDFYLDPNSFNVFAPQCPTLDDPDCFYMSNGSQTILEPTWFITDYKTQISTDTPSLSYKDFVEAMVTRYRTSNTVNLGTLGINPPAGQSFPSSTVDITPQQIFAWGLGNEFQVYDPNNNYNTVATMQNFIKDMGCAIHAIDPNPMVTSGFMSTLHATFDRTNNPADLYTDPNVTCADGRKALDFGTVHAYENEWSQPRTAPPFSGGQLAQYVDYLWFRNNIPYIVEELGFTGATAAGAPACRNPDFPGGPWGADGSGITANLPGGATDRGPATDLTLDAFFSTLDADGVLQWSFTAGVAPVEDGCTGMSDHRAFLNSNPNSTDGSIDWPSLYQVYCEMAEQLDGVPGLLKCAANSTIIVAAPRVDVVVVMDTTGSMGPSISGAKQVAINYIDALANSGIDYRAAVVDYKDKLSDPYASRVDLGFTTDRTAIVNATNALYASGGGDLPEDVYSGIMTAVNLPWRNGVKKVILLMGDAGPHDPESGTGFTLNSVIAAANAVDPVSIYTIRVGSDPYMRSIFQQLASGTGGMTFDTSYNISDVSAAILRALGAVAHSPSAVIGENNGQIVGTVGTPIHFDASHSFDVDGFVVRYDWDFNNDGVFDFNSPDPATDYIYAQAYNGLVTLRVTDNDGNTGRSTARVVVGLTGNDTTPPVINITSPLAQAYLHTASVSVSWTATDTGSGVASSTGTLDGSAVTNGQSMDLFFLSLGSHTLTVNATDNAGNSASASVTFTVVADINSLIALEQRACTLSWISGDGVCNSLLVKLQAAKASIDRGQFNAAKNQLNAFMAELDAQNGKKVTQGFDLLKSDTVYVVSTLP